MMINHGRSNIIALYVFQSIAIMDTIFMVLSGKIFVYVACSDIIVGEFDKGT